MGKRVKKIENQIAKSNYSIHIFINTYLGNQKSPEQI
jgi:hypothetical protein